MRGHLRLADIDMVESLNGAEFDEEINNAIKGDSACRSPDVGKAVH